MYKVHVIKIIWLYLISYTQFMSFLASRKCFHFLICFQQLRLSQFTAKLVTAVIISFKQSWILTRSEWHKLSHLMFSHSGSGFFFFFFCLLSSFHLIPLQFDSVSAFAYSEIDCSEVPATAKSHHTLLIVRTWNYNSRWLVASSYTSAKSLATRSHTHKHITY